MALGLDDAILGWLVAAAGDALFRGVRGDRTQKALRQLVRDTIVATVAEVGAHLDSRRAKHLCDVLLGHGAQDNRMKASSPAELQTALQSWIMALDHPPHYYVPSNLEPLGVDVGQLCEAGYLSGLGVDPGQLADALCRRVTEGIERDGRRGGALKSLAEWLWRDDISLRLERIEGRITSTVRAVPQPRRGGLPGGNPLFTGRQEALAELTRRIEAHDPDGTVVAVHAMNGMAGVGKTQLVLRAAHQCKHRYPDGQYFINLHGYTPDRSAARPAAQALELLLHQAGVAGTEIPAELEERQDRWQALMAGQKALIVLDNALDIGQVRPLLPNSPGCLVLVTSRSRLPGVDSLRLDVLERDEATELFTRLVGNDQHLDQDAVSRVVEFVGFLPIAVEAAAGQIGDELTVTELARSLAEAKARSGLVDEVGPEAGVQAALETSLRRLHHADRHGFRMLGLHPGPVIGVPQFAALADWPIERAGRVLRTLSGRNLIKAAGNRVGHRRYELHDLVYEFAHQQAESRLARQRPAATARLICWYTEALTLVERLWEAAGGSKVDGLDLTVPSEAQAWLAAEQDNLLALATATEPATSPPGKRAQRNRTADAADLYYRCADRLHLLGYYPAAGELHRTARDIYRQIRNRAGEANTLSSLGELARLTGDYASADSQYRTARDICQQIGYRAGEADALRGLGLVARQTGDYPSASEQFRAALAIYRQVGDRGGEADALRGLGGVAMRTGDYPSADEHLVAAREIYQQVGDRRGEADAVWGFGAVALGTGDYPSADEQFRAALAICRQIGYRGGEAAALWGSGQVALRSGDYASADEQFRAARDIYQRIGDRPGEADTLTGLGRIANVDGRHDDACRLWQEALAIYVETGNPAAESVRRNLERLDRY